MKLQQELKAEKSKSKELQDLQKAVAAPAPADGSEVPSAGGVASTDLDKEIQALEEEHR